MVRSPNDLKPCRRRASRRAGAVTLRYRGPRRRPPSVVIGNPAIGDPAVRRRDQRVQVELDPGLVRVRRIVLGAFQSAASPSSPAVTEIGQLRRLG